MSRLLVLLAALVLVWIALELFWRWARRRLRRLLLGGAAAPPGFRAQGSAGTGSSAVEGRLVRCSACGVAVPEERALREHEPGNGQLYCSESCRGLRRDLAGFA